MNNEGEKNHIEIYKDFQDYRQRNLVSLPNWACRYESGERIGFMPMDYDIRLGYRTEFQRDRDDILYSPSFRQLSYKRQMFSGHGIESYFTRLTHTLIVSQIARSIARGLQLDEHLTEAIALGHDIGHSPYGHSGEKGINNFINKNLFPRLYKKGNINFDDLSIQEKLNKEFSEMEDQKYPLLETKIVNDTKDLEKEFHCLPSEKNIFDHHKQGYRLLKYLDKSGRGLELTKHTYYGIFRSSGSHYDNKFISWQYEGIDTTYASYEVQVVRIADDIAWTHHDLEQDFKKTGASPLDALNSFRLTCGDEELGIAYDDIRAFLQLGRGEICGKFITDIIEHNKNILKFNVFAKEEIEKGNSYSIELSPHMQKILNALRKIVISTIHNSDDIKNISKKSIQDIEEICNFILERDMLEKEWCLGKNPKNLTQLEKIRFVCDFVSFMSDEQADRFYQQNLGPHRAPEISPHWYPFT